MSTPTAAPLINRRASCVTALFALLLLVACGGGEGGGGDAPDTGAATDDVGVGDVESPDSGGGGALSARVALQFEPGEGRAILVEVALAWEGAEAPPMNTWIDALEVTAAYGVLDELSEVSPGRYRATLLPPEEDEAGDIWTGEIPVTARVVVSGEVVAEQRRVPLVLPFRMEGLGQPEAVPGLVNTPGMEDSPEVSPDGELIIIGSYSPVDLGYCQVQGTAVDAVGCNHNTYDPSARPDMFGAARIVDGETIVHAIDSLGYDPSTFPTPIATPPVASFGFRRQPDGSYAEPFVLGVDAEGYTWNQTYGYTFDPVVAGRVFFSFNEISDTPDTLNDMWQVDMVVGEVNRFGYYEEGELRGWQGVRVPIADPTSVCGEAACEYGNPNITAERLWFDNERQTDDIFFVDVTRDAQGVAVAFSPPARAAFSQAERGETMPHWHGGFLYYMCGQSVCRSRLLEGADPRLDASWEPEQELLSGTTRIPWQLKGGRSGRVVATSEPSVADVEVDGEVQTWLHFGYIMQVHYGAGDLDFGGNWNMGRVRIRDGWSKRGDDGRLRSPGR